MHLLDFLDALWIGIELSQTFLDELTHDFDVLLNAILRGLSHSILEATQERVDTRLERHKVDVDAVDLTLVWQLLELTPLLLKHLKVVNPVLDRLEMLLNVVLNIQIAKRSPGNILVS